MYLCTEECIGDIEEVPEKIQQIIVLVSGIWEALVDYKLPLQGGERCAYQANTFLRHILFDHLVMDSTSHYIC